MPLPPPGTPLRNGLNQVVEADESLNGSAVTEAEYYDRNPFIPFKRFSPQKELRAAELDRDTANEQKITALVIGLRLMGYDAVDIAEICEVDLPDVTKVVNSEETQKAFEQMLQNTINHNANIVQGRISALAHSAVNTVQSLMSDEKQAGIVRLKSAQDILDRSGTGADQFFGRKNESVGGADELQIVFTDDNDEKGRQVEINMKRKK